MSRFVILQLSTVPGYVGAPQGHFFFRRGGLQRRGEEGARHVQLRGEGSLTRPERFRSPDGCGPVTGLKSPPKTSQKNDTPGFCVSDITPPPSNPGMFGFGFVVCFPVRLDLGTIGICLGVQQSRTIASQECSRGVSEREGYSGKCKLMRLSPQALRRVGWPGEPEGNPTLVKVRREL